MKYFMKSANTAIHIMFTIRAEISYIQTNTLSPSYVYMSFSDGWSEGVNNTGDVEDVEDRSEGGTGLKKSQCQRGGVRGASVAVHMMKL